MSNKTTRRKFMKSAVGSTVGAVVGTALVKEASAAQPGAQSININPQARAVMADGRQLGRGEVLQQLGLNPNTPPDAWLAIFGCGSNASALQPGQVQGLLSKGAIKREQLDQRTLQQLEGRGVKSK